MYKSVDTRISHGILNNSPNGLIAHSDDFRWFGDESEISEWTLLVNTFGKHKYKVTDVSDTELVGINITRDDNFNYNMDQTRVIDEILAEAHMRNEKDERLCDLHSPGGLQGLGK